MHIGFLGNLFHQALREICTSFVHAESTLCKACDTDQERSGADGDGGINKYRISRFPTEMRVLKLRAPRCASILWTAVKENAYWLSGQSFHQVGKRDMYLFLYMPKARFAKACDTDREREGGSDGGESINTGSQFPTEMCVF
ncbi:hypothetical protein CEXT_132721 [Caerostris extrusa]|uniref:Uncharacterized protein n=1 Tax=Caerostris extrusa TaxID=172846 RepID=A0AAV4TR68_CAEEX|nr:hypothetical protein CEXT_132721 [Caerostris extrusa]